MKYNNNVYIHRNQPFLPNFPKSPTPRSLPYCHLPSPSLRVSRLLRWAIKRWSNTSLPQNKREQCYPFYIYMEKLRVYFFVKWVKYLSILFRMPKYFSSYSVTDDYMIFFTVVLIFQSTSCNSNWKYILIIRNKCLKVVYLLKSSGLHYYKYLCICKSLT